MITEVKGDLIKLALAGEFDVITHGCNCFCTMGAGIAVGMRKTFRANEFPMEDEKYKGDINKLGTIDYKPYTISWVVKPPAKNVVYVVNSYTQYHYGRNHKDGVSSPVDYVAIRMCMRKINHVFNGLTIGLPWIGAGLAGGDWNVIKPIIEEELVDMNVVIVEYDPNV